MKITPTLRALLVAMCLCMVFSLFACTEEVTPLTDSPATDAPTEEKTEAPTSEKTEAPTQEKTEAPTDEPTEAPGCAHEEVVLEGKAATCTESGLTEGKKCSKCDEILVPQEEIPAAGHKLDAGTPAENVACGEKAKVTFKCENCDYTMTQEGAIVEHALDDGTVTTAPTCTEKGVKTVKCTREGCEYTTTVEIDALGHDMDEGSVTTAPTCTDKGVKTFTCKRECGHTTTEEIPATGHGTPAADATWTLDEAAPQTEKTKCPNCDGFVTRPATKTTAGFTVFTPDALMSCDDNKTYKKSLETENGMKYYHMVLDIDAKEGNIIVNSGAETVMGVQKYVFVIARKKGTDPSVQIYVNAKDKLDHVGAFSKEIIIDVNAGWQLLIFDGSNAAQIDPANGVGWIRLDAIDGINNAKGTEFDIAALGFAASKDEAIAYFGQYVKAYGFACPHVETADSKYVQAEDKHGITCGLCGETMATVAHSPKDGITYNEETKTYVGTCICGADVHSAFLVIAEAKKDASGVCKMSNGTDGEEDYVRYEWNGQQGEMYAHIYKDGSALSGSILVFKYRLPKGCPISTFGNSLGGTVESANSAATGNGDSIGGLPGVAIADGEWHYMVVDIRDKGHFTASADGKYYAKYLRMSWGTGTFTDENGETKNSYIDIGFVAFADNLDAINKYIAENETDPEFQSCLDAGHVTVNGEKLQADSFHASNESIKIDLAGKTLNTASSVTIGGWVCARGGIASYKYRVVKAGGEAVAEPVDKAWAVEAANREDIYNAIGKGKYFTADCDKGAGITQAAFDLTGFEGQKVDVEFVAVTNAGYEIVVVELQNVTVPTAPAAQ